MHFLLNYHTNNQTLVAYGEMAEWSNAIDSKSIVPISGTQGSNPCLTANKQNAPFREFFVYMGGRELNPGKEGFNKDERRTEVRR